MNRINILRLVLAAVIALPSIAVSGQNLDPTVVVSREYEGKIMEVHKPQLKMAVPDSVLRFDLEFDYSVTDTPYKGAYEFSPYVVEMKPSPAVYDHKSFYLKAGAGYSLHPELDAVWSPKFRTNAFRMNVYASHGSYFGNYWNMAVPAPGESVAVIDRVRGDNDGDDYRFGFDLTSRAGVEGRYDWEKGLLGFDVSYDGIHQKDEAAGMVNRSYNAAEARFRMASKNSGEGFVYRLGAFFRYGGDALMNDMEPNSLGTTEFGMNGELGRRLETGGSFAVKLGFDWASADDGKLYSRGDEAVRGLHRGLDMDVVPHYEFNNERWYVDLGVRLSMTFCNSIYTDVLQSKGHVVYPDVRIEYKAIPDALKVYADFGGDSRYNSYSDILKYNRRLNQTSVLRSYDIMDISVEKISAVLGLQGRIGPRFSYDFRGGYANYDHALLDGITFDEDAARFAPSFGYASYEKAFAAVDMALDTESFRFDASAEYSYFIDGYSELGKGLFLPASLTGDVSFSYIWKKRLAAGLDCRFSGAREGQIRVASPLLDGDSVVMPARVPGYADLGVSLEYALNRKLSLWARGGNLLGMTIQRSLLYAEKGPYFTAGICLNL